MKRKKIKAITETKMFMSPVVDIQTNEISITIHEVESSVYTILVFKSYIHKFGDKHLHIL